MTDHPVVDMVDITLSIEHRDAVVHALRRQYACAQTAVLTSHTPEEAADARREVGDPDTLLSIISTLVDLDPRDSIEYRQSLVDHLKGEHRYTDLDRNDPPSYATLEIIHRAGHRHEQGHPS